MVHPLLSAAHPCCFPPTLPFPGCTVPQAPRRGVYVPPTMRRDLVLIGTLLTAQEKQDLAKVRCVLCVVWQAQ